MPQAGVLLTALASYDFLPQFSARVRTWFYNPLGVLLAVAVVAMLCGFFVHPQSFILLGGVGSVIAFGVSWPWLSMRGLRGAISFGAGRVRESESVDVSMALHNRWFWPAWGLFVRGGFDGSAHGSKDASSVAAVPAAPGRTALRCEWKFVPRRRGVYPRTAPQLATGFPFGLWESRRTIRVESPLLVWPRTLPVGPVPQVSGECQLDGNVSRSKVGSNGDVLGVRPYRRGDSPRRIHWGQSARHDRLIVCELQSNARPLVQLILDADADVHVGAGADSSREWAIRILASLAEGWLEEGVEVSGLWNDTFIPSSAGAGQARTILDSLACLPDSSPKLVELLQHPACRSFSQGLQIIVTTDLALAKMGRVHSSEDQRWVVLCSRAFDEKVPALDSLPVKPWLLIENIDAIGETLRTGWVEARHGS